MNKLIIVLIFFGIISLSSAMAENITPGNGVVFQVVQSQIVFDHSAVKSAHLITSSSAYGVHLILRSAAAKEFSTITKNGIGKISNIVLNGKIVSSARINSPLGNDMIITLPTKKQAEKFIKELS